MDSDGFPMWEEGREPAHWKCTKIMSKIINGKHSTNKELYGLLVDAAKEFANSVLEIEGQEEYDKLFN